MDSTHARLLEDSLNKLGNQSGGRELVNERLSLEIKSEITSFCKLMKHPFRSNASKAEIINDLAGYFNSRYQWDCIING